MPEISDCRLDIVSVERLVVTDLKNIKPAIKPTNFNLPLFEDKEPIQMFCFREVISLTFLDTQDNTISRY